jgi:hypothetical protein
MDVKMKTYVSVAAFFGLAIVVGCSRDSTPAQGADSSGDAAYRLTAEPAGAAGVIEVREHAKDGDEIVVVGRIGGASPWIEGRAAFSIVDGSLKACSDIPGDQCTTPWDYCCETDKLPTATALVKIVDESGALVKTDARQLLQVKELSTVVVKGKAQRDDAGNLVVLASGAYVRE